MATAHQLVTLDDELAFTDAPHTDLEVIARHTPDGGIGGDALLQIPQRIDGVVVQIAAIDKGPQPREQRLACCQIARHRPRLHQGVALPFAAMVLVVVLHRRCTNRDRTRRAKRPEHEVNTEDEAIFRRRAQELDHLLHQLDEVLTIAQCTRTVGFARLGVGADEVNVAGIVQLIAAELAHAEHDQAALLALLAARRAEARQQLGSCTGTRRLDSGIGKLA